MNKKIVVLGGGTGLSTLLRGLKHIEDIDISAIVTVSDNGGSTGVLSHQFKIPAVGDLRRVIASLSDHREELDSIMDYRFKDTSSDLDGHTLGNLIITSQIMNKGNFAEGIEAVSKMLNVRGTIIPVANEFHELHAILKDGSKVKGEESIGHSGIGIDQISQPKGALATVRATKAILEADYVIFGIGSLYTSLMPNLVYPNMKQALEDTEAKVIYFANIFTQHGETDNMSLKDHVEAIEKHTHQGVVDEVIVSNTFLNKEVIDSYEADNQFLVKKDMNNIIEADLVEVVGELNSAKHSEGKIIKVMQDILK